VGGYDVDAGIAARMRAGLQDLYESEVAEEVAAARRVGEALRRVADRLTATSAPPEILSEMAELIEQVGRRLGPYRQVRDYAGFAEASGLGPGRAFFDWSPLLGQANPLAPPMTVEADRDRIVGRVRFGIAYEGPPGCVHGGLIAAAFDELLGLTQSLSGRVGMTGTLSVKYRRPTPLHTDLLLEGRIEAVEGRKVITSGRMMVGDILTAEATGLFVSIEPERFRALTGRRAPGVEASPP
jgi:acyl-coenzyme A thioesterase PaaI-like protein/plasmid stabilization system protein ParE